MGALVSLLFTCLGVLGEVMKMAINALGKAMVHGYLVIISPEI